MKKRGWKTVMTVLLSIMLILATAACGKQEQKAAAPAQEQAVDSAAQTQKESTAAETQKESSAAEASEDSGAEKDAEAGSEKEQAAVEETAEPKSPDLSEEEIASLMKQVAENQLSRRFQDYMPDEVFANAEIFGIDRDGDSGTAYVHLNTAEYVKLKDKAYLQTGSLGEAIIRFEYTDQGPKLTEVIWSEDGAGHDEWVKNNFPEEYLQKSNDYDAYDADGKSKLGAQLTADVEKALGVPVESENLLNIDEEQGTYEIVKTHETFGPGKAYSFEVETIEQGNLSDLAG